MVRTFSTGIEVPTAGDRHPSEAWWSRVGATTNAAILSETKKTGDQARASVDALRQTVTQDYVDRATASQYGIQGPASTISIGTVQGGATAAASMSGSAPAQILNLTLPQGPRGPEGPGGAFQMKETADPGLFEVSDAPNAALQAAAEAALKKLIVDIAPRNLTATLTGVVSGTVSITRFGPIATLRFENLVVAPTDTNTYSTFSRLIPAGFRPPSGFTYFGTPSRVATSSIGTGRADNFGNVIIYDHKATDTIRGVWTWWTPDAAPTALPGTAM